MKVNEDKIEIVKSRTYTLDQHDIEVVDAFCDTIMGGDAMMKRMEAAKGLVNMLDGKRNYQTNQQSDNQQCSKPKTYCIHITEVKPCASIVFGLKSFMHVTSEQKSCILDVIGPWCKYKVEEDK